MKSIIAILIVNWKSSSWLLRCLEHIAEQEASAPDVFVLDNDAEEPIPENDKARFPSVHFVQSKNNIGFAAGNNLLFRETTGSEWIALVNPDAFLEAGWLSKMLSAAKAHPEFSCFACRLVQESHHEVLDGAGDVYHVSGRVWRDGHGRAAFPGDTLPREVFSPCAAAALYRREAFEAVGGFDEDFFCYFEDIDLGFRLRLAGHRCLLVPDAVAYHVGSATTGGQQSDFAVYHGHRNMVWTFVKNMPGILFWIFLPLHICLNLFAVLWFCLRGQGRVILRSKRDALGGIPRMWKKRRDIQNHRKVSVRDIWRVLDKSIRRALSKSG